MTQVSIDRWMDQQNMVYIYTMEYDSTMERNKVLIQVTTWMNLERIKLNEISQIQNNTYDTSYMKYL